MILSQKTIISTKKTTWTSAFGKKNYTVFFLVLADGFILLPIKKFWGKTNQTINNMIAPECFAIATHEDLWIDEPIMFVCFEEIWQLHAEIKKKKVDLNRFLTVYNAFKVYITDNVKVMLSINSSNLISVPPDCSFKDQVFGTNTWEMFYVIDGKIMLQSIYNNLSKKRWE